MVKQMHQQEFKVVLDGLQLQPDVVERLNHAVQRAVLQELADVHLGAQVAVARLAAIGNGGRTSGIWIRVVPSELLDRAGIEAPAEFR